MEQTANPTPKPTPIQFLGFEGCPNTPVLLTRLRQACPDREIIHVDLMSLNKGDVRLGWGAPTILVHGKDLFGLPASAQGAVSCRNWSDGLPSVQAIKLAIKETQ